MIFNDSYTTTAQTYTFTANTLTRSGIAPITWDTMSQVILYTYAGSNQVNVQGVAAGTSESIATTAGDVVTIGSLGTLANILGYVNVESGGTNTASVVVDDPGNATADFSTSGPFYILSNLAPGLIQLDLAAGSTLDVQGGSGSNTFTAANPPTGLSVNLGGGSGSNTLVGANATNSWNVTGLNSGTLGSVSFTGMQNLVGGAGVDDFQFTAPAACPASTAAAPRRAKATGWITLHSPRPLP